MPNASAPADLSPTAASAPFDTTVLIVGAGPVGLTLAAELTRYGVSVRLVDMAAAPSTTSKALVVWPRTLEHLDRLGLADTFAAHGLHTTRARIFRSEELIADVTFTGPEITDDEPGSRLATPFPFALMIPQSETERLLLEHLGANHVEVERGTRFVSCTQDRHGVCSTLTNASGETFEVRSRWIVGCDGAHSTVRAAAGATLEGDTLPSRWLLADIDASPARPIIGPEIHLHNDGVLALFPIPEQRMRVVASVSLKHAPATTTANDPPPTVAEVQAILDRRAGEGFSVVNPHWLSSFRINERTVGDFRHGRLFLAGDAAHIHSPAGGQGMNTGMQDSVNLAWKLALVERGLLTAAGAEVVLESYTVERAPVAAEVIRDSGRLTRMATIENGWLQGVRSHVIELLTGLKFVRRAFAAQVTELAVSYPATLLNATDGHGHAPHPGQRLPRPDASYRPVSPGSRPLFTVLAAPGPQRDALVAAHPDLLDTNARPPLGTSRGLWIVRPDGYIGFAGASDAWTAAHAYLARLRHPGRA